MTLVILILLYIYKFTTLFGVVKSYTNNVIKEQNKRIAHNELESGNYGREKV